MPNEAAADGVKSGDRLNGANPFGDSLFTDRNWTIVDALKSIAAEVSEPPARIALAWALSRPAVDTVLVGVSRVSQLRDNIGAVALTLSPGHLAALDAASRPELPMIYGLLSDEMRQQVVFGGAAVLAR